MRRLKHYCWADIEADRGPARFSIIALSDLNLMRAVVRAADMWADSRAPDSALLDAVQAFNAKPRSKP